MYKINMTTKQDQVIQRVSGKNHDNIVDHQIFGIRLRQRRRWLHPRRIFKCLLHHRESTCAKTFFSTKFQCKDANGIQDISLLFNIECDAEIRKNSYGNFMSSGGTAIIQGTVDRATKEPTVLAPTTMNFPVAAPPQCRGCQMSLRSKEIVDFSCSTRCE